MEGALSLTRGSRASPADAPPGGHGARRAEKLGFAASTARALTSGSALRLTTPHARRQGSCWFDGESW